jgi:hypothetical protein
MAIAESAPALLDASTHRRIGTAQLYAEKTQMPLSGEAIRMMNYVDDVATTMRRLLSTAPMLTPEERARVSEYLRTSSPSAQEVLGVLDKKEGK